jgi:uncharacterized protein YbaA (DUF1428 family)
MPNYVDGFVIPLPKKNRAAYVKMARLAARVWREHGALDYRECIGDDLAMKFGRPFPRACKLKPDETVVFAWIEFKSRAHRDRVNAKVMQDPRLKDMCGAVNPSFDVKRMQYGGFSVVVT